MNSHIKLDYAFLLILFFTGIIFPQDVKPLFGLEKEFCKTLTEIGLSKSFMQFMDDEAAMFIPTPINGMDYYKTHPNEMKTLFWEAEFAEISADGNFGYTTGPWYIPKVSPQGDTTYAHGHFNTVWHKVNGKWKFLIDCGVNYGNGLKVKNLPKEMKPVQVPAPVIERKRFPFEDLIVIDNDFAEILEKEGIEAAYKKYASENIRAYRDNKPPYIGIKSANQIFSKEKLMATHMSGKAANSGDLAFTFGTVSRNPEKPEFNYMKVWKLEGKLWKIVLDVLTGVEK